MLSQRLGTSPTINLARISHTPCYIRQFTGERRPITLRAWPHRRQAFCLVASAAAAAAASAQPTPPAHVHNNVEAPVAGTEQKTSPLALALEVLKPDAPLVAVTVLTVFATVITTLAFPLAIGDLFDVIRQYLGSMASAVQPQAAPTTPWGSLMQTAAEVQIAAAASPQAFRSILLRLSVCLVLSATGNAAVAFLAPTLGERFGVRMRKRLMEETLSKSQSFFDASSKGDLVARLTLDVATLQTTVADFIGQRGVRSMLEVACSLAIISMKNPLLAVVSFVVTPALSAALRRVVNRAARLTYSRQQAAASAMDFATDRLTHVRTVQLFAQEGRETAAYGALADNGYVLARRSAVFQGLVEGAGRLAVNIGTLSLLGLGGYLVLAGRISLGTLLAFQVYNLFLSVGLASVAASVGELGKALGALERVAEVVGAQGRDPAAVSLQDGSSELCVAPTSGIDWLDSNTGPAAIELKDVYFKYPSREDWALRGLSLKVAPGTTVALVGRSGSGKSTAAALLLGLYQAQKGEILIDGVQLNDATIPAARAITGTVLQQPSLLSGSIADQVRLGAPLATLAEVQSAARLAHADGFINDLPEGYDAEIGERGLSLSGGQKQRISIARALVRRPRLLILDEPTAALDVEAERAVDDALRGLRECTKVIIAHRLSTVRRADVIAVVHDGRVVEQGTHEELMAKPGGQYRKMVLRSELEGDAGKNHSGNGTNGAADEAVSSVPATVEV